MKDRFGIECAKCPQWLADAMIRGEVVQCYNEHDDDIEIGGFDMTAYSGGFPFVDVLGNHHASVTSKDLVK